MQFRRSDYDVTNTVQVSSVAAVRRAVEELVRADLARRATSIALAAAFADFERLFTGQFPGYFGCDTVYHDMQHSLDDTLAMARLLAGYDRSHAAGPAARRRARADGPRRRAVPRRRLHPPDRRHPASQRRRVHPHARQPRRALPGALPADDRHGRVGAGGDADHALHRLRSCRSTRSASTTRATARSATCSARPT